MNTRTPAPLAHTNASAPIAHTPTPWKIGSSNEVFGDGEGGEAFSEWLNIVGPDGKTICELPGHSQFARGSDVSKMEDANAALIVTAVNAHARLTAQNTALVAALDRLMKAEAARRQKEPEPVKDHWDRHPRDLETEELMKARNEAAALLAQSRTP